jgi:hypothetical protein
MTAVTSNCPRIVGREVYEGVIIDFTPDGVPIVDPIALISQSVACWPSGSILSRCHRYRATPSTGIFAYHASPSGASTTSCG